MKAIVQDRFGPPEVLELREVDEPEVGEGEVLVRVQAASVNPADWYAMTGAPWVARAQMGLRKPRLAVQTAKALGAEVTGVCSTRNVAMVASLGADQVIDYTREDFTRTGRSYHLLLDVAGSRSWPECRRVLAPLARFVMVGAPKGGALLGPLGHIIRVRLASLRASQKVLFFISKPDLQDLVALQELLEAGTVTPVVERTYELREAADAFRYLGEGHAQGKLVISMR
jgi:NADPH:quinone reductase-like Zn-dependent oxidoreductase